MFVCFTQQKKKKVLFFVNRDRCNSETSFVEKNVQV